MALSKCIHNQQMKISSNIYDKLQSGQLEIPIDEFVSRFRYTTFMKVSIHRKYNPQLNLSPNKKAKKSDKTAVATRFNTIEESDAIQVSLLRRFGKEEKCSYLTVESSDNE